MKSLMSLVLIVLLVNSIACETLPPPCSSEIYCYGRLLDTVQMSRIYPDSKSFVDMPMKQSPNDTLALFDEFMKLYPDENPPQADVKTWVENNFDPRGSEFEPWTPKDFKENPAILNNIKDKELQSFAKDLNKIWLQLGRQMTTKVRDNPDIYSIVWVENPVIVPGGRFLEFYYWDSFWIILGLLRSEMTNTAKGMLENFAAIVQRFGFVPNGGRVYYSMRSQPPLLIPMVKTYVDHTKDKDFAVSIVDTLAVEFDFWMSTHTTTVNGHTLAKYGDRSSGPRPESYREDIATASGFATEAERDEQYRELKAAAESGMDFSSRWFINDAATNVGDLRNLKTRSIIPVELNAVLYWNAVILAEFYGYKNDSQNQAKYSKVAEELLTAVTEVLWNEEAGAWLDFDLINNKSRPYFVPTNLAPLWTGCFCPTKRQHIADRVVDYIKKTGIDSFPGGVPTTLYETGEQWDMPNVWPPMQHILIVGLENLGDKRTKKIARSWAQRWVEANYKAFQETGNMYEKYSATKLGGHGGGGEYGVQLGFGWSNGVVLDLLNTYGSTLTASTAPSLLDSLKELVEQLAELVKTVVSFVVGAVRQLLNVIFRK